MSDLKYFRLFPKRYKEYPPDCPPKVLPEVDKQKYDAWIGYWNNVRREHGNFTKKVDCSDFRWYVITFKDGHKELAYFRYRTSGWWTTPPMCKGVLTRGLIPRQWTVYRHARVKDIRLAF